MRRMDWAVTARTTVPHVRDLIADRELETWALADLSPVVRGRAAEALGLIGDTESGPAIGVMVGSYVKAGALANIAADESAYPLSPEVEAARLGIFALTRLKAYAPLAGALLDVWSELKLSIGPRAVAAE